MKDKSWRQEYIGMKVHSQKTRELLENGPKSLSQSWYLQAMYNDWKSKKGYKDPNTENKGQCQSSFKEFESIINQSIKNQKED